MFKTIAAQIQAVAACFLLFAAVAGSVNAQEALLSSDVTMDVTGTDANDARTKAMLQAQRDGLDKLLTKLAPEQKAALMSKLNDEIISAMVKSVEVQDEKIAGSRYRASLRINYNALAVNTLLDKKVGAEGAAAGPASTAVLVIPVFTEGNKTTLWEPDNAWREAWRRAILEVSGGNIVVPYGDNTDVAALTTESVMSANYEALAPFFSRYGVSVVMIVKASYHKGTGIETSQAATLDVLRRDVGQQTNDSYVLNYRADPQEERPTLLLRAARDLIDQINHQREEILTREAMTSTSTDTGRIMVLIPTSTLDSWTKVRASLLKLQTVTRLDVLAMSPQQVDTMLQFKGPKASLASDITALGLRVQQLDNYWVVSRE